MKMDKKRELKRATILQAALETFLHDGYLGAGMDTIANRAGVTKQTVYRYFESKEVLFQAALEAQREASGRLFLDELQGEDTSEALRRFAIGFLEVHMSEEHLAGVRLLLAEGPSAPEITRVHFALGPAKTATALAEFLKERFHVDDPEYAVKMLLSTLLSIRLSVLVGLQPTPTHEEIVSHAERTVDLYMHLMR